MFTKYTNTITEILQARGTFDTTPETVVNTVLDTLSGLVQADRQITDSEVSDLASVNRANESSSRSLIVHLVDALNFIQDIKLMSSAEPDIAQGLRDGLWRAADVVQQEIECAVGHVSQDELEAWHDIKN